MPVVSLESVSVVKGGARLLDEIDWEIHAGERWVLFGPNGSGKTTLMEIVSSYLFPTSGTVRLFGERLGTVDVREIFADLACDWAFVLRIDERGRPVVIPGKSPGFGQGQTLSHPAAVERPSIGFPFLLLIRRIDDIHPLEVHAQGFGSFESGR